MGKKLKKLDKTYKFNKLTAFLRSDIPEWQRGGYETYEDYLRMGDWIDEPLPEFETSQTETGVSSKEQVQEPQAESGIRNRKARQLSLLARAFADAGRLLVVGDALYAYNSERGCYEVLSRPERALERCLPTEQAEQLSCRDLLEMVERVKRAPYRQKTEDAFNADPWRINCRNGVVDLSGGRPELNPHSDAWLFTYCVDASYVPFWEDRDAPVFEGFCATSLDGDETKRRLLLEIIGYLCSDTNAGKCAFFLKGTPNSGKSVIAEFLCRLFCAEQVANVSLHKLSDRFNKAELFGKKVNICGEIKAKKLEDITIFKMVTGGDRIQAEHKGKDPFTFRPHCKLLFSGNALPGTREADSTAAFVNRLVVLLFDRSIPREDQDKALGDKLWAERNAIFSMAVDAFQELAERNFVFTQPEDSRAFLAAYRYSENSVRAFVEDCCVADVDARIFNRKILEYYSAYCVANGLEVRPKTQLYDAIDALPGVRPSRIRIGNENCRGRIGVRIMPSEWNNGTNSSID